MTDSNLEDLDVAALVAIVRQERAENAKLRTRAQEAEQARDGLQRSMQAAQVDAWHKLARSRHVREEALDDLDGRVKLSELLGEDGWLDESKAAEALDGVKSSHGYYFEQPPAVPASSGSVPHLGAAGTAPAPTFGEFLHDSLGG